MAKISASPPEATRGAGTPVQVRTTLPPNLSLLFGDQRQRDFASIVYRMAVDEDFAKAFMKDPAHTLAKERMRVAPEAIQAASTLDGAILERITKESSAIMAREAAFTVEGGSVMHVAVVAAFLAGALLTELMHHHGDFADALETQI